MLLKVYNRVGLSKTRFQENNVISSRYLFNPGNVSLKVKMCYSTDSLSLSPIEYLRILRVDCAKMRTKKVPTGNLL